MQEEDSDPTCVVYQFSFTLKGFISLRADSSLIDLEYLENSYIPQLNGTWKLRDWAILDIRVHAIPIETFIQRLLSDRAEARGCAGDNCKQDHRWGSWVPWKKCCVAEEAVCKTCQTVPGGWGCAHLPAPFLNPLYSAYILWEGKVVASYRILFYNPPPKELRWRKEFSPQFREEVVSSRDSGEVVSQRNVVVRRRWAENNRLWAAQWM